MTPDDEDKENTGGKIGTHGHPGYKSDEDARREAEEAAKRRLQEEEEQQRRQREKS